MKKEFQVIGIGEVLWDLLPDGKELGGAPANFAYHISQLGASSVVISSVGTGAVGREIIAQLKKMGLKECISKTMAPTGTVGVQLQEGIPSYTIYEDVAWDNLSLTRKACLALEDADAICFGTLAQRSEVARETIDEALELVPDHCLKIFDINLRQHYYSREIIDNSSKKADVIKLNDEELVVVSEMFGIRGTEEEMCRFLIESFDLKLLALTKGARGSMLMTADQVSHLSTPEVKVEDTVGAGDSFTATLTMGMLCQLPLQKIHDLAVRISAFICTRKGATPVFPADLKKEVEESLRPSG